MNTSAASLPALDRFGHQHPGNQLLTPSPQKGVPDDKFRKNCDFLSSPANNIIRAVKSIKTKYSHSKNH